jgi:predicted MFS family arabinose efflux permease
MIRQPSSRVQVLVLATSQALFQTVSALVMTIGALAGARVAPTPQLATAPIAALFLGTVVGTIPATRFMARAGRKTGFVVGALLGVVGGLVGAWGIFSQSLLVLSLGTFLDGGYQAFAQFYRFAASEVADARFQPRAISLVIAGGVVAAVLGPGLASVGGPLLEPAYVGSFLILSVVSLIATGVLTRAAPSGRVGSLLPLDVRYSLARMPSGPSVFGPMSVSAERHAQCPL